jgi:hypothetical protein
MLQDLSLAATEREKSAAKRHTETMDKFDDLSVAASQREQDTVKEWVQQSKDKGRKDGELQHLRMLNEQYKEVHGRLEEIKIEYAGSSGSESEVEEGGAAGHTHGQGR